MASTTHFRTCPLCEATCGLAIARANAGASVNDLTDDQVIDPLSGNAVLNAVPSRSHAPGRAQPGLLDQPPSV